MQAIDSLVAQYQGDGLTLSLDMGRYATTVDHLVQPTRQAVTIHGRPGQVVATEQVVVLLVPKVHDTSFGSVTFSMTLRADDKVPLDVANKIFQSIEFKPVR